MLLDCGPDFRAQALAARLPRLDAILFTHNHVDHTWGLDEVRRFNAVMKRPIDIYADAHTMGFLRRVYQHIFDKHNNVNDSFVATLVPHVIEPATPLSLCGVRITPIPLLHGRLPILGYRFDAPDALFAAPDSPLPLAYCTDISGVPPDSWPYFRGLKTLVLGALRHRKHPTHLTLDEAVVMADRIGAGRTYFVHMAHDLGHEATQATLPEQMFLAHDGLELG
jgi:phosphoribosyl 1,2-cyclic phosphate phosphodiesterase